MKNKEQLIGWVLMFMLFFGWTWYSQRDAAQQAREKAVRDSIEAIELAEQEKIANIEKMEKAAEMLSEMNDTLNPLFAAHKNVDGTTVIKNELLALTISNKGGQIQKAEILDPTYKNREGKNVVLFDENDSQFEIAIDGKDTNIKTSDFFFAPQNVEEGSVVMSLPIASGSLNISYSLVPNSYLVKMDIQAKDINGFFSSKTKTMSILWTEKMKQQEKGYDFENRYATITYRDVEEDTHELSSMGGDEEEDEFEDAIKWISYKDQFFSQVLIAEKSIKANEMQSVRLKKGSGYLKSYTTDMTADFDPSGVKATSFAMYLGPNKFSTLRENEELLSDGSDLDLQSLVYLGWPIIRWINRFVFLYIFDWMTSWGLHMGLVLLILTIAVKFLVFPLMKKSHLSSSRMRVLRPKMEEISKQYPNPDQAMQKQQAMMQLYSEYGTNPMGGCLPMLIQMPIWIALFNFIPNAIELRGQSFLWADDLSTYDDIINWGVDVWGIGDHLSLFCVLWCVSTLASSWFSMRQQQDSMTPEQAQLMGAMKWMSYLMPLIFFFSFNSYSSGLNYYYFISTLTSVLLMWYLRKTTDDEKLLAQLEAKRKERKAKQTSDKRPSGIFSRMQELQQKQMEILQAQQEAQKKNKQ